jgi:3-oxo-5-alpha-steroid 4-dehydrogenase 1
MIVIAVATFITLYFVDAGYGIFRTEKWGCTISNRWAWFFMELPIFLAMIILWLTSKHLWDIVPLVFLLIFQSHYIQRTLIFPFLLKGKGRMPIGIMCMGISFNILNAMMQGYWIFHVAYIQEPQALFVQMGTAWFCNWRFILGTCLFIAGYVINLRSDYIIRHLRKNPEDTKHYFPKGFMFNYVTSANYFGELMEWLGFAILTWSVPGLVFFIWTFANLAPRAHAIHKRYKIEFPEEMKNRKLKRVIPFIY